MYRQINRYYFSKERYETEKYNTYVLMYGYGYEKQLAEFLTYYLYILQFDYVIFVEDFKTKNEYKDNSVMKNICGFFGERVIYDYLIRDDIKIVYEFPSKIRDNGQIHITNHWANKLREKVGKGEWENTWMLYVNCDEFLDLNGISIEDFLEEYGGNNVGFSFLQNIFGDNGVKEHMYDSLLIDTHRRSYEEKMYEEDISNKMLRGELKNKKLDNKGWKSMYRIDVISKGWMHMISDENSWKGLQEPDNKIRTIVNTNIGMINHYRYIDEKSIDEHHSKRQYIVRRIDLSDWLRENSSLNSDLWKVSDIIRDNSNYRRSIEYLDSIYKEGFVQKRQQTNFYESYVNGQRYVFIHIGKCGGTTINRFLNRVFKGVGVKYSQIHMNQAIYQSNTKYIIWIRDPLTRYVSAFNWVYEIVTNADKVSGKQLNEIGILGPVTKNMDGSFLIYDSHIPKDYAESIKKFKVANNLAEQIYTNHRAMKTMVDYTQHINRGIAFYLNDGEFIKDHHEDIVYVGTLENFDNDISELKKILNINTQENPQILRVNKSSQSKYLSPLAKQNLKKFYELDYYCLQLLAQYNLIDYNKIKNYFE